VPNEQAQRNSSEAVNSELVNDNLDKERVCEGADQEMMIDEVYTGSSSKNIVSSSTPEL
jgi:hypothetical protein